MTVEAKLPACEFCGLRIGNHDQRCQGCGADVRLWVRRGERVWGPFDLARVRQGQGEGRIVDTDEVAIGNGPWVLVGELDLSPKVTPVVVQRVASSVTLGWAMRILGVAVLIALALSLWAWQSLDRARDDKVCRQNLQAVWLAAEAYRLDCGQFPAPSADWPGRLAKFLPPQRQWWTCTRTRRPYVVGETAKGGVFVADASDGKRGPHDGRLYMMSGQGPERVERLPAPGTPVTGLSDDKVSPAEVIPAERPAAPTVESPASRVPPASSPPPPAPRFLSESPLPPTESSGSSR